MTLLASFKLALLVPVILLTALLVSCKLADNGAVAASFGAKSIPANPDPLRNWSLPPQHAEQIIGSTPYQVKVVQGAGSGVTGAKRVDVLFEVEGADEEEVYLWEVEGKYRVKTKPFPSGSLDGLNNAPRKEIAAYEVQKLFLDPVDYVVPTTIARCVPLEIHHRTTPRMRPTLESTSCVLNAVSLWLKEVTLPDVLYDKERFRNERAYAYHLSTFNILTYLMDHKDNRKGNFLISTDDKYRRVFAIDNGIGFGSWFFNWFFPSSYAWRKMVVPAVPRSSVDRLRALRRKDLDALSVLAEFKTDENGVLQAVEPGASLDPTEGVNIRDGRVQLGLTEPEIEDIWKRIQDLLRDVDEGQLATF